MSRAGIYVETSISGSLDEVWRLTQVPELHERWDLRFTTIQYLPRGEGEPQRFLYETRIGFGLGIAGEGESTGTVTGPQSRTSALHFWSEAPLSLIRDGRGYWKYLESGTEQPSAVRFWTWYDYEVRWGALGKALDWLAFRPLIGWATAWSFDRLRLWVEHGVPPETVRRATMIYSLARLCVLFVWLWHGAVPKLLFPQGDEIFLLQAQHLSPRLLPLAGVGEVLMGLAGLIFWRWRGYLAITVLLMALALLAVAMSAPQYLLHAFNPVTLNVSVAAVALCGYLAAPEAAFAGRCRRRPVQAGDGERA